VSVLPKRSASRLAVLIALLAAALLSPPVVLRYALPALSPFMWLCTLVATHALGLPFLCGLPMLVFVVWRRRGFCHFLCPMGWIVELCAKARPSAGRTHARVPHLGQWAVFLSVGGAIASVPLFLLLDPMAVFVAAAGAVQAPLALPRLAYAGLFALVVALSLVFPLVWCRKVCPLGATQDLLAEAKGAFIQRLSRDRGESATPHLKLARRAFLGTSAGMAVSALSVRSAREAVEGHLRPPGSTGETEFSAMCIRCGNCLRSCPTHIIQPDLHPARATSFLVPALHFDMNHCLETCNLCGQNCPTGAIAPLPIAEKNERRIGIARIESSGCLLALEKECGACALVCRREAIVEEFSKETYTAMVRVDEHRCNGCGACIAVCPPRVITVVPPMPAGPSSSSA
jgi:ferredoxin-type protein NapF